MSGQTLDNLSTETRVFPPSPSFVERANLTEDVYGRAVGDRLGFWAEQAHRLQWSREWNEVLDWSDAPFAKWF
ncbi:acetyl-coenzyme A synthetase N-terminal domain-containing protein, partial [Actinokineospora sp. 24-640]